MKRCQLSHRLISCLFRQIMPMDRVSTTGRTILSTSVSRDILFRPLFPDHLLQLTALRLPDMMMVTLKLMLSQ